MSAPISSGTGRAARSPSQCGVASDRDRQAADSVGGYRALRGNREAAARHLEAVVLDRPEMRVALAAIYTDLGDVSRRGKSGNVHRTLPTGSYPGCGQH